MAIQQFAKRIMEPKGYLRAGGERAMNPGDGKPYRQETVWDRSKGPTGERTLSFAGNEPGVVASRTEAMEPPSFATSRYVSATVDQLDPAMRNAMRRDTAGTNTVLQPGLGRVVTRGIDLGNGQYAFATERAPAPVSSPAAAMGVDRNGDGIPDGAEVRRTMTTVTPDGAETMKHEAKWVHKSPIARPEDKTGDRFAMMRENAAVNSRDTGNIQFRQDRINRREATAAEVMRGDQALAVARGQGAEAAQAEAEGQKFLATEQRKGTQAKVAADIQIAANELTEKVRQFDTSRKIEPLIINGEQVGLTVNSQLMDLRKKTQEGFYELKDSAGNVTGAMTKDGVVLKKNEKGEWTVDRPETSVVLDPTTGQPIAVQGKNVRPLPVNPFGGMGQQTTTPPAPAGMVNMRDPTSNVIIPVPQSKVEYYVGKGGVVVP